MLSEIVKRNRSYRRFVESDRIATDTLVGFIENARLTPSARNIQPLKYCIVNSASQCEAIFPHTAWAGYLENGAPVAGERPAAYIIVCNDTRLAATSAWDQGIVAQTILLSAVEESLGGCIIVSINKKEIAEVLRLPDHLVPVMAIALGRPLEQVVITEVADEDIKYYRQGAIHYVPKRKLDDIIISDGSDC